MTVDYDHDEDRDFADCDDREDDDGTNCGECAMFGDYQCSKHAEIVIQQQRELHEFHEAKAALETLIALPEAWNSEAYRQLRNLAPAVLTKMARCGG